MHFHRSSIIALVSLASVCALPGQENKSAATPPAPAFTWGGDLRLRYEDYDSVQTLNADAPFHIRDYLRFRARAWAGYTPLPELSFYGRLAAEPRYWYNNSTTAGEGREAKYVILDNLYARWSASAKSSVPVTVLAGRQDIQLGDQWLVGDGTPIDGSWTNFFDAVRATFDVKGIETKFDVIALNQQAHPKDRFPIVGRQGAYTLMEQDENGVILCASNKSLKDTQLDGYLIYKEDHRVTNAGNTGKTYTFGVRAAGAPSPHWQYSAEAACQWGRRDLLLAPVGSMRVSRDIRAHGFNGRLTYLFKDALNNQIAVLAEYLSGDDKDSATKDEMFDILWGRYPRVGETWAAAYAAEANGRPAQYQNLFRTGATWTISPTKSSSIASTYCAMFAPEKAPTRATNVTLFSQDGHFRGHMVQVVAKQKFTKAISGLLFVEASFLGDYYSHHDRIAFIRAEVLYTF